MIDFDIDSEPKYDECYFCGDTRPSELVELKIVYFEETVSETACKKCYELLHTTALKGASDGS